MNIVRENVEPKQKLEYVGRAWINNTKDGTKQFIAIKIDKGIALSIGAGDSLLLFNNKKREGRKDADYRLAVMSAAA